MFTFGFPGGSKRSAQIDRLVIIDGLTYVSGREELSARDWEVQRRVRR